MMADNVFCNLKKKKVFLLFVATHICAHIFFAECTGGRNQLPPKRLDYYYFSSIALSDDQWVKQNAIFLKDIICFSPYFLGKLRILGKVDKPLPDCGGSTELSLVDLPIEDNSETAGHRTHGPIVEEEKRIVPDDGAAPLGAFRSAKPKDVVDEMSVLNKTEGSRGNNMADKKFDDSVRHYLELSEPREITGLSILDKIEERAIESAEEKSVESNAVAASSKYVSAREIIEIPKARPTSAALLLANQYDKPWRYDDDSLKIFYDDDALELSNESTAENTVVEDLNLNLKKNEIIELWFLLGTLIKSYEKTDEEKSDLTHDDGKYDTSQISLKDILVKPLVLVQHVFKKYANEKRDDKSKFYTASKELLNLLNTKMHFIACDRVIIYDIANLGTILLYGALGYLEGKNDVFRNNFEDRLNGFVNTLKSLLDSMEYIYKTANTRGVDDLSELEKIIARNRGTPYGQKYSLFFLHLKGADYYKNLFETDILQYIK